MLRKLSRKNKDQNYIEYLKRYEAIVELDAWDSTNVLKNEIDRTYVEESKSAPPMSLKERLIRHLQFEIYHTVPTFCGMIFYCLAHFSIFEILTLILKEALWVVECTPETLHMCLFMVGFILTRLSGGVYIWMNDTRYAGVKFDVHNKFRMNEYDAKIMQWFRRHPRLKMFVDLMGAYLCYVSISHILHNVLFPLICDIREDVIEGLPSMNFDNRTTRTKDMLSEDLNLDEDEQMAVWKMDAGWDSSDDLAIQDEKYLWRSVSANSYFAFYGEVDSSLASLERSLIFYVILAVLGTVWLNRLGLQLID